MVKMQFSHMGLSCKDPIALEKFYTRYFGFKRVRVFAPGEEQVVMLQSGNVALELFKAKGERPGGRPKEAGDEFPGWRHIAFIVDNLDAKLAEIGNNAGITLGPLDMAEFVPGMRVCWIADPEGNIIELNQGYVDEQNPPPLAG